MEESSQQSNLNREVFEPLAFVNSIRGTPKRIKTGSFLEDGIHWEGNSISWDKIGLVSYGPVEYLLKEEDRPEGVRKLIGRLTGGAGENKKDPSKKRQVEYKHFIDIYAHDEDAPVRFVSTGINYSFFFSPLEYVSFHNFYHFCVLLLRHVPEAYVNDSFKWLIAAERERIEPYGSLVDFELDTRNLVRFPERLTLVKELDLSTEFYLEKAQERERFKVERDPFYDEDF